MALYLVEKKQVFASEAITSDITLLSTVRIFQKMFDQTGSKLLCTYISKLYLTLKISETTYYVWSHFCPL